MHTTSRICLPALACVLLSLGACQPRAVQRGEESTLAGQEESEAVSYRFYVGTSTGEADEGIYTLQFVPGAAEELTPPRQVATTLNPSFLALAPEGRHLYAVREAPEGGGIVAYRRDAETGALSLLNRQPSGGSPAYVSTDHTGDWVLAANYGGGSVALLPVREDGRLGPVADVEEHEGTGPDAERQEGPHAHYVRVGPGNRYVYAADLGIDEVRIYTLNAEDAQLEPAGRVETAPGAGPRHLDFHPNGRYAYLANELNGTVTAYARDASTGALTALQTRSTLPSDFDGFNKSADIHVHPSGRWLYVSNRGDFDSIAVFEIDAATGRLSLVEHQSENIHWPRNFAIAPGGRHLLVANRRADEVVVFALDAETGRLTPTEHRATVPDPTNITFVAPGE